MQNINVYIIVEPSYQQTPWWRETKDGLDEEIKKSKLEPVYFYTEKFPFIQKHGFIILLGATLSWVNRMVLESMKTDLKIVLASIEPVNPHLRLCYITSDRKRSMSDVVRYLYSIKRRKPAYFGISPEAVTDVRRYEGFIEMSRLLDIPADETDVYYCLDDMDECMSRFIPRASRYDAVICNNDMTAVFFLARCKKNGIQIPQDLYLVGFGNSLLGRCCVPDITTSTLDLLELGQLAITLGLYSYNHPKAVYSSTIISSRIIVRGSTERIYTDQKLITDETVAVKVNATNKSLVKGMSMQAICRLENFLSHSNEIDFDIINALKDDASYAQIAERLFIADNTLRYHIERMYQKLGVKSRKEFEDVILQYIGNTNQLLNKS